MNDIKKYKLNLKQLFFSSVDNDLDKWERLDQKWDYRSPNYLSNNNERIYFRTNDVLLLGRIEVECNGKHYGKICSYFWIIPIDFKVWRYVRKIKKQIKNKEYNIKNIEQISKYKFINDNLQDFFIKDIRKEKLKKLK